MNDNINEIAQETSKVLDSLKGFDIKALGIIGMVAVTFCTCGCIYATVKD